MHEMEKAKGPTDVMGYWEAWLSMTPEVWKNVAGIAADYFENSTSFANSLQHTNQEHLGQLQSLFSLQQDTMSREQVAQLAPLPQSKHEPRAQVPSRERRSPTLRI